MACIVIGKNGSSSNPPRGLVPVLQRNEPRTHSFDG
jgi:hypothetical protein